RINRAHRVGRAYALRTRGSNGGVRRAAQQTRLEQGRIDELRERHVRVSAFVRNVPPEYRKRAPGRRDLRVTRRDVPTMTSVPAGEGLCTSSVLVPLLNAPPHERCGASRSLARA